MVSANNILTEINRLLAARFNDVPIYINLCPIGFLRPSLLIRLKDVKREDAGRHVVLATVQCAVTCFASVDDYHQSDAEELLNLQNDIMTLFDSGYIKIGDRAVKVKTNTGSTGAELQSSGNMTVGDKAFSISESASSAFNSAVVVLEFKYYDDRAVPAETYELMGSVKTNTNLQS